MIQIKTSNVYGMEHVIRGMRNPMNSWDKSDSHYGSSDDPWDYCDISHFTVGENDRKLMRKLAKAGTDHRKFMRMMTLYLDITAPLYWWKEFDTYKVGTVANSCSTMHKIHEKEFTLDDFSCEHLFADYGDRSMNLNYSGKYPLAVLCDLIHVLNNFRTWFIETNDKKYWWQMIQLLPSSYNQKRTVMLNYEVLANIYKSRKNHKLDEWREFCHMIETLPYSEIITGMKSDEEDIV